MSEPITEPATLDRQKALERIDGDVELLDLLSVQFLSDLPPLLSAINAVQSPQGLDDGVRALHTLKSCAATVGADRLSELARRGERAAREGATLDLSPLYQAVQATVQALAALGVLAPATEAGVEAGTDAAAAPGQALMPQHQAGLERLLPLLEAGDIEAFDALDALGTAHPEHDWRELTRRVQSMDFASAAQWVRQALGRSATP